MMPDTEQQIRELRTALEWIAEGKHRTVQAFAETAVSKARAVLKRLYPNDYQHTPKGE